MSNKTIGQIRLVRFHDGSGVRVAFTRRGRKFLHVVAMDSPMVVQKVRLSEERYMQPLKKGDDYYPYKRAVQKFMKAADHLGITDKAKDILDQARKLGTVNEIEYDAAVE